MARNVFDHDDAVIDQDADSQGQREHRQQVEVETQQIHQPERGQHRCWDGDHDDQRAPPGVEEQQQNQPGQKDGLGERSLNGTEG